MKKLSKLTWVILSLVVFLFIALCVMTILDIKNIFYKYEDFIYLISTGLSTLTPICLVLLTNDLNKATYNRQLEEQKLMHNEQLEVLNKNDYMSRNKEHYKEIYNSLIDYHMILNDIKLHIQLRGVTHSLDDDEIYNQLLEAKQFLKKLASDFYYDPLFKSSIEVDIKAICSCIDVFEGEEDSELENLIYMILEKNDYIFIGEQIRELLYADNTVSQVFGIFNTYYLKLYEKWAVRVRDHYSMLVQPEMTPEAPYKEIINIHYDFIYFIISCCNTSIIEPFSRIQLQWSDVPWDYEKILFDIIWDQGKLYIEGISHFIETLIEDNYIMKCGELTIQFKCDNMKIYIEEVILPFELYDTSDYHAFVKRSLLKGVTSNEIDEREFSNRIIYI